MLRKLPFLIGLVIVTLSGLAHGLSSGRWRSTHEIEASVQKLAQVPEELGDWHGKSMELDPREMKAAGIVGSVYRRYENTKTGAGVTLFLVSGPTGPISVHSPEVCYPGVGYTPTGERTEVAIGDDKLFAIQLAKESALSRSSLVIYYGWNGKGNWVAPSSDPRFIFSGVPVLYKMYIIQDQRGNNSADPSTGPAVDFAKVLLPVVRANLFGNSRS